MELDKLPLITISSNFHRGRGGGGEINGLNFNRNEGGGGVVPLDLEIHYPSFPSGINNNWLIKYTVLRNWTEKTS